MTSPVCISVIVFGVVVVIALVWWSLHMARESRVISVRMKDAATRLHDVFDEEVAKYQLVALYSSGPNADPVERAQHITDSSAEWANLLFRRYADDGAELAYDEERARWIAGVPLFDGGPLVAFSLEVDDPGRPMEALAAAVGVVVDDAPPVIDIAQPPSAVCVRYQLQTSHWEVYQPCEECGGGWLSTHFTDASFGSLARWTAQRYLVIGYPTGGGAGQEVPRCAHCLARAMRESEQACHQPTCWYDTFTGQWMLSESLGDGQETVSVPLGIATFFVNHRVVLAAANHQLGI